MSTLEPLWLRGLLSPKGVFRQWIITSIYHEFWSYVNQNQSRGIYPWKSQYSCGLKMDRVERAAFSENIWNHQARCIRRRHDEQNTDPRFGKYTDHGGCCYNRNRPIHGNVIIPRDFYPQKRGSRGINKHKFHEYTRTLVTQVIGVSERSISATNKYQFIPRVLELCKPRSISGNLPLKKSVFMRAKNG